MSRFRDELVAAATEHITDASEESQIALCDALEGFLRTSAPRPRRRRVDPDLADCDGVVLRESVVHDGRVSEFLGYSWLVQSQKATPLRARFWSGADGIEFEIRFGISKMCLADDELESMWKPGAFPRWDDDDWAVTVQG